MQSFYHKAFQYIDNTKPSYLGIYFSLFFHLSILLFAIGIPDFFRPNKIPIPQVIPIEILNISDVTSLAPKKEGKEINESNSKKIKQKKFNSSENTEIKKIDLQEKPISKLVQNENLTNDNLTAPKFETKKINIKEKIEVKLEKFETLEVDKIKPKLKPKPTSEKQPKNDMEIKTKTKKQVIENEKNELKDKPELIPKPEKDFNISSMLKDLRNEEVSKMIDDENNEEKENEKNEKENQIQENLEVSISEMDLVIQQLRSCFNPRAGTQIVGDEMVKISAKIDKAANVRKDTVQIIDTNISKSNPYYEAITESALATLFNPLCSQLKLPLNKYESWKDLKITIDYSWIKN